MSDIIVTPTNETPVASAKPAVKADKKRGSNKTTSKQLYRFPSRGGKAVKKTVESVKRLRNVSRLTPEMRSAAAYFANGLEVTQGD